MSEGFNNLTKADLLEVVEMFGTDVRPSASKADIIAALLEDGVDYETYEKFNAKADDEEDNSDAEEKQPEAKEAPVKEDEPQVLLRMTRGNGTFEIRGYRFTREHPYALVSEENADYLIEEIGGFRIASPREAKEFYS
jgi:hypothetical protein